MNFSDASCLSALWMFTLPTSRPRMLRPLSTMKLLSAPVWRRFQANGRHWPDSALRLLFRFLARWCPCAGSPPNLRQRGARSMSALS